MRFLILVLFPDMTDLLSHKETFSGSYLNYKQFTTRSGLLNWLFPNMYVVVVFFFFSDANSNALLGFGPNFITKLMNTVNVFTVYGPEVTGVPVKSLE